MIENAKITVKGIVQGVGYRWYADRTARKYEVKGFVEKPCRWFCIFGSRRE